MTDPTRPASTDDARVDEWLDLPQGTYEGANRYSTDDEEVLTLWRDGKTVDLRQGTEQARVEAIRYEAGQRLRRAFYTSGPIGDIILWLIREKGREDPDVIALNRAFEDVMLVAEPGKAEYAAATGSLPLGPHACSGETAVQPEAGPGRPGPVSVREQGR